jgi:hypothetical protein
MTALRSIPTMPLPPDHRPIDFSGLSACPACEASWQAGPIPEESQWLYGNAKFFSRVIGLSDHDRVVAWQCPDCCARWDRETGKRIDNGGKMVMRPKEWR